MRLLRSPVPAPLLLLFAAAACGGGGGGNVVVVPSASLSTLAGDPLTAPADGTTDVLLSATVRDDRGAVMANLTVRFEATGTGLVLTPPTVTTDAAGLATARLRAGTPGTARIAAIADPGKANVRLSTEVDVDFTPVNAPVVQGLARYLDANGDGALGAGDAVVVPFSTTLVVDGATAADFVLPVTGDTLGNGATVAAGPNDNEVTITLGTAPRLRTRGLFGPAAVTGNEPSGIAVTATSAIRDLATGTPATGGTPIDVAPASVRVFETPQGAEHVVVGQFTFDGALDLLAARGTEMTVFVGDGALGFTAETTTPTQILDVVAADLNHLTAFEVLTAETGGVQVWNNPVSAVANESALTPGGFLSQAGTRCVAVADVNLDAFPDVLIGTTGGIAVFLHQRNLGNTFVFDATVAIGEVTTLAVGDVDGDGDDDVVAGVAAAGGSTRLVLNENGALGTTFQVTSGEPDALAAGDLDSLPGAEIAVAVAGEVRLFRFEGASFTSETVPVAATDLAIVDIDRDSFGELAIVRDDRVELWMHDRAGSFAPLASDLLSSGAAIATADLDGDGDTDFVIGANDVEVRAGSSAGTFGSTTFVASVDLGSGELAAMAFGDVDGDGELDRLVGTATGVEVQLGDGVGGFVPDSQFAVATPNAIALADLDGDGDLDAVLAFDGTNEVYTGFGSAFTLAASVAPGSDTLCLALFDYDRDGDVDLVFGNDGENQVFENVTTSTLAFTEDTDVFSALAPNVADRQTIALLAHDVDNEGDIDLLVVNGGTEVAPQDSFLLKFTNTTGPRFTLNQTFVAQLLATAAVLGDRDGDVFEDLVIARRSAAGNATLQQYRGQRTNFNTLPQNIPGTPDVTIRAFALDDVDGDGRSDLVLANAGSPSEVWRQDAAGAFALVQQFDLLGPVALFAADLDHDGDLDLVTLETGGPSRVFLNR